MSKFFQWFFSPSTKNNTNSFYLAEQIIELKSRVEELEKENRELKDLVMEVENNLRAQIDKINPVIYNIIGGNKSA
tara:strand:+ start:553 stop:780 length:228 start_codon:yes stop_codon:yes gene_type:complete